MSSGQVCCEAGAGLLEGVLRCYQVVERQVSLAVSYV